MAWPGLVSVELSIEEHLIKDLIYIRSKAIKIEHANDYDPRYKESLERMMEYRTLISAVIKKLYFLKGLEGRKPGMGKFTEITEIKDIIKKLSTIMRFGVNAETIDGIDSVISELNKLKSMELRLG